VGLINNIKKISLKNFELILVNQFRYLINNAEKISFISTKKRKQQVRIRLFIKYQPTKNWNNILSETIV